MTVIRRDPWHDLGRDQMPTKTTPSRQVGVVAIGRNEGSRIEACIRSAGTDVFAVVYVDSGSTDNSVQLARNEGAHIFALDMGLPFTAARARNAGYRYLRELIPDLSYVQFVDGDCEIDPSWIGKATTFLDLNSGVAVVCGRRREKYPSRSLYNALCDIEWDTPLGQTKACGGDALIRATAFEQVSGYREDLIAGEEPELCLRLRSVAWKIWRLDAEMTRHDANILRFGQWWRRHVRSGYAFAQGAYLHGRAPERHWVWETIRALFWGLVLPVIAALAAAAFGAWGLSLLLAYPLQFARRMRSAAGAPKSRIKLTLFEILTRFPESLGVMKFTTALVLSRRGRLIEYR